MTGALGRPSSLRGRSVRGVSGTAWRSTIVAALVIYTLIHLALMVLGVL